MNFLSHPSLFVTGTDTGVGKTVVSCALVRAWREAGHAVAAVKPIETGVHPIPEDARALRAAAGDEADDFLRERDLEPGAPILAFREPLGPVSAARAEGQAAPDSRLVFQRLYRLLQDAEAARVKVLLEGAGGLLVPLASPERALHPGYRTLADLIRLLGVPAVLATRTRLGTINHTLLSVEAMKSRRIDIAAVVASRPQGGPLEAVEEASLRELREHLPAEVPLWVLDAWNRESGEAPRMEEWH